MASCLAPAFSVQDYSNFAAFNEHHLSSNLEAHENYMQCDDIPIGVVEEVVTTTSSDSSEEAEDSDANGETVLYGFKFYDTADSDSELETVVYYNEDGFYSPDIYDASDELSDSSMETGSHNNSTEEFCDSTWTADSNDSDFTEHSDSDPAEEHSESDFTDDTSGSTSPGGVDDIFWDLADNSEDDINMGLYNQIVHLVGFDANAAAHANYEDDVPSDFIDTDAAADDENAIDWDGLLDSDDESEEDSGFHKEY